MQQFPKPGGICNAVVWKGGCTLLYTHRLVSFSPGGDAEIMNADGENRFFSLASGYF